MSSPYLALKLVEFTSCDAYRNMAIDMHLLDLCEGGTPHGFLRFYTWRRPALSLGYLEPADVIDSARALEDGVEIVRRPTGGRVVFHGDDLTYTVVVPVAEGRNVSEIYKVISRAVVVGLNNLGAGVEFQRGTAGKSRAKTRPCFASVSRYEITNRGRKIVGSAQRIGRRAVLQHGSIPLGPGYMRVVDYLDCPVADKRKLLLELEVSTCWLNDLLGKGNAPATVAEKLAESFIGPFDRTPGTLCTDELGDEIGRMAERLRVGFQAGSPIDKRT